LREWLAGLALRCARTEQRFSEFWIDVAAWLDGIAPFADLRRARKRRRFARVQTTIRGM
jgi:hypothetical protein